MAKPKGRNSQASYRLLSNPSTKPFEVKKFLKLFFSQYFLEIFWNFLTNANTKSRPIAVGPTSRSIFNAILSPRGVNRWSLSVPWIQVSLPLGHYDDRWHRRGKMYASQLQELYKTHILSETTTSFTVLKPQTEKWPSE